MKYCFKCNLLCDVTSRSAVKATCAGCGADLHVCRNCRFYDTFKPSACQIPDIDPVMDKERATFCDEFEFADRTPPPAHKATANPTSNARDRFDSLFKKKP